MSIARVAGVFDNFMGLPLKPPSIEVLDGRKLGPSDVLGLMHHPQYAAPSVMPNLFSLLRGKRLFCAFFTTVGVCIMIMT